MGAVQRDRPGHKILGGRGAARGGPLHHAFAASPNLLHHRHCGPHIPHFGTQHFGHFYARHK
jgi:hypothetical protein